MPPAGQNGHAAAQHAGPGSAPASAAGVDFDANGQNEQQPTPATDPFQLLFGQFSELREYVAYYLTAKADSAKLGLRKALFSITLAALGFVVVASLFVAATWLVVNGTAEGLGVLFGNRPWAGSLLTGLLLAAGLGGGMYGIVIRLKKTAREGTVAKYENRQARQQVRYGHNVADCAAANGPEANDPEANGSERK
jgi:RNase P/RNase MRP subunit POP5